MSCSNNIQFYVNGELHKVKNDYPITTSLNFYLRNVLKLTGTKVFCKEGGCGVCAVHIEQLDSNSNEYVSTSVNSCLLPLYSCNNLHITTVEGIGSQKTGLHPIQKRLADYNGSQCGYCSPGFVMSMYSLLKNNPKPTKEQIENSLDGNICRCTGYRAILDSMKSFAHNAEPIDIEDLKSLKCLNKSQCCSTKSNGCSIQIEDQLWHSPENINDLFDIINKHKTDSVKLVSGNTSVGYYKDQESFKVYINLKNVQELQRVEKEDESIKIGSAVTLSSLVSLFEKFASDDGYNHLSELAVNLRKIGNTHVRNMASWSGNLVMKKQHPDFLSDVVVFLEAVSAQIEVFHDGNTTHMTISEFLSNEQLNNSGLYLITSMRLPKLNNKLTRIKMFKVTPRAQNSLSYVSCGFRFDFNPTESSQIASKPIIAFNGVSRTFFRASRLETYLEFNNIHSEDVFKESIEILKNELKSSGLYESDDPLQASAHYRANLCLSLYYKFFLSIVQPHIKKEYESALESIVDTRPISNGSHVYEKNEQLFPLTKPMPKLSSYAQTSGESKYVDDLSELTHQLHGAFILTQVASARIASISTEEALKMPGVKRILLAKDILGENNIMPKPFRPEPLFTDDLVEYAGQPIGLVIADTYEQAKRAAKHVKVNYSVINTPILTISDAVKANSFHPQPVNDLIVGNADEAIKNAQHKIQGEMEFHGTQFNFYLEGIYANCEPTEDGYKIEVNTQWLDTTQRSVAMALGIQNSSIIDIQVKQLGGGFGGKTTRTNFAAAAAALGAYHTHKPVKVGMDLNDCMDMIGKRPPWYVKYEIGFDDNGKLQGIKYDWYSDPGFSSNGSLMFVLYNFFDSVYNCPNYYIKPNLVKTNKPASTEVRSPDLLAIVNLTEQVMDHIASYLKKDPLSVRQVNFFKKGDKAANGHELSYIDIDGLVNKLVNTSEYHKRREEIELFNKTSLFKKRGISLIPLRYAMTYNLGYYNALVAVRHHDGSVAVSHGGVEMGQGIHTKVAQVISHEFGIPIEKVSVKSTNNLINPNCLWTGGSVTSELCSKSVLECCNIIKSTLEPVRKLMPENYTWEELIAKAFSMNLNLSAMYLQRPPPFDQIKDFLTYDIDAASCSEVLIDVLTGEIQVLRTDILYDCGQTMNGLIDIGQAEGGFLMGLGAFLLENTIYDPNTGKCLNNGTWDYKPPQPKDVPIDLRIAFLEKNPNPVGFFGSKAVGEPPVHLSNSVLFAIKDAVKAARQDRGAEDHFRLEAPATVDKVQKACLFDSQLFKIY